MRIAGFSIIWLHASGVPSFPPDQKTDCAKDDGKVAACRSMQRKMRRLNQPESVDEFFANLHERVDDDMLRGSAFYDSGDFLLKAFGLAGILGCHVYSFDDGKTVQLNCDQDVLIVLYGCDPRASVELILNETGQYALLDSLYRRFRDVFGGGWQRVDAFDKKHDEGFLFDPRPRSGLPDDFRLQQERMVWQKTFHSLPEWPDMGQPHVWLTHPSQYVQDGFGKDIRIHDVVYRIRVGHSLIEGGWGGISIAVLPRLQQRP